MRKKEKGKDGMKESSNVRERSEERGRQGTKRGKGGKRELGNMGIRKCAK